MSATSFTELSEASLLDLFRMEVETQAGLMTQSLMALEQDPSATHRLEELMRGAHSLKGAARIVNRDSAVRVAHAMEDCLVAAQRDEAGLQSQRIDQLLRGVDLLTRVAHLSEAEVGSWDAGHESEIDNFATAMSAPVPENAGKDADFLGPSLPAELPVMDNSKEEPSSSKAVETSARAVRVTAENLNRLLGLAGESVVASRWVDGFAADLQRVKRLQSGLMRSMTSFGRAFTDL